MTKEVEATMDMLAGLSRLSLELLAFNAFQVAKKNTAATALADIVLRILDGEPRTIEGDIEIMTAADAYRAARDA